MKPIHLRIILPLKRDPAIEEYCRASFRDLLPGVTLSASFLLAAQESTVSDYDQTINAPWILKAVQAAVADGCDGIFIHIAFDTALSAARSLAEVPVVGGLDSAVGLVRQVASRFSILAINHEEVPVNHRLSREYGFAHSLVSVETIDIPVHALRVDPERTLARLELAAKRAIDKGAAALLLGCSAMGWATEALGRRISVPVLDTGRIGLYVLHDLVRLGLKPSRVEYPSPSGLQPLTADERSAMRPLTFAINPAAARA